MNGYIHRRICYERGVEAEGKEIYEFHGFCTCKDCCYRRLTLKQTRNYINVTTKDASKIPDVEEFIRQWECADGTKELQTAYYSF